MKGLDTESREMVVDTVRQLRKRLLTKEKILEYDRDEIFPEDVIRKMLDPEIGLQLLFIPEAYGGLGGGAQDCGAVTREMARICLGVGTAFFAIQLGADPLLVGGTEEQKAKWLGKIAEGNTLVAYAVTEAGAGSNLSSLKTKAEPITNDAGEVTAYKINGTKQFISTGGYADYITLLANTPEGPTFFVVEKEAEGFVRGKGEEKHGIRASNTSPLSFTDVIVPVENLIGGVPGVGMKQANQVFGYTRLMVASLALGAGLGALDIAIPYAKERIQFGTPLSEKQGYTHKLIVPGVVKMTAAEAYIEEIGIRLDSSEEDLQVEGSIGKLFTTETANKTADDCIQALGGYGYISEYEVEKIKRDVKITCIYEGTSEIQQSIISTFRWKKSRKTKGAYYGDIAAELAALSNEQGDIGADTYSLATTALNETINFLHDNRLTKQQYAMFTMADMMTYVEVGAAMARKAAKGGSEKKRVISRIFANDVAQMVAANSMKIVAGSDVAGQDAINAFMDKISYQKLVCSAKGLMKDMDRAAEIIFE